jgi:hypothetical protein
MPEITAIITAVFFVAFFSFLFLIRSMDQHYWTITKSLQMRVTTLERLVNARKEKGKSNKGVPW